MGTARFGVGEGPIHMDDVACGGNELRLTDCLANSMEIQCQHEEDAGVICRGVGIMMSTFFM